MANITPSPCGASAALDEAKAKIDELKSKIAGGLDSIGDLGSISDSIKAKLSEVNIPKIENVNLQAELAKLPYLNPDEYAVAIEKIKNHFGSSVPDLDSIIDKIPKPPGLSLSTINLSEQLKNLAAGITTTTQDIIDSLSIEKIAASITDLCKEVPNVESKLPPVDAKILTDSNNNPLKDASGKIQFTIDGAIKNENGEYVTADGEKIIILTDGGGNPVLDGQGKPVATTSPETKPPAPITPQANPKKETKPDEPPVAGFTFTFTKEKLIKAAGPKAAEWYDAMLTVLPKYNITTPERVAAFLGNCRTETGWTTLEENLNYGAKYLFENLNPGKKRFPTYEDAVRVERKPEPIANIIYMVGRKLLDPQPGDGWKYRGRGLIQLTFKDGYLKASKAIYGDDRLVKNPDMVAKDKATAIETAAWYFKCTNVNAWADKKDWGNCRSITNAGRPGLDPSKIHGYATAVKNQEIAYDALKA